MAAVLAALPGAGEAAVHELLRRILVNEMLGNPDMHLKNIGLRYPDGKTAEFPPAYDIVGYAAYGIVKYGRALHLMTGDSAANAPDSRLRPAVIRAFCSRLGLTEKPAWTTLRQCAAQARAAWPALIAEASITEQMKARLIRRLQELQG